MISIFILVGIFFTTVSKANPFVNTYAVDGVQGVLYEVPEYEDPELALLQLTAMGVMPVLTILQDVVDPDEEDSTCIEEFNDVKKSLDGIIDGLQLARSKFEEGSVNIDADIGKSISNLMKLKHHIRAHVISASTVDHNPSASHEDGLVISPQVEKSLSQVSTTPITLNLKDTVQDIGKTFGDVIGEQSMKNWMQFQHRIHALNHFVASDDQEPPYEEEDHDIESQSRKTPDETTTNSDCSESSESSDSSDSSESSDIADLAKIKTLDDGLAYQDDGKAVFHKKWSWMSSNEV